MKITVTYFAALRDERGLCSEEVQTSADTLANLYAELQLQHNFSVPVHLIKGAVANTFVAHDYQLKNNDAVFLMPPVSGG